MTKSTASQQKLGIFHEHVIAFILAAFLVVGIGGFFFYRDTLFADITGASTTIDEVSSLPIVYNVADGALRITSTRTFDDITSMTFFIVFDPSSVLLQLENAESPYEFTFAPSMETMMQVTVIVKGKLPADTPLFTVPVNGSVDSVTLSNAGVLRQDGKFESLAIQKK